MNDCCVKSVPQSDSSYEMLAGPVADWEARLRAGLNQSVQCSDETLGHLEEQILRQTRRLERRLLEEAAQKKADQTPPVCLVCGHPLSRRIKVKGSVLAFFGQPSWFVIQVGDVLKRNRSKNRGSSRGKPSGAGKRAISEKGIPFLARFCPEQTAPDVPRRFICCTLHLSKRPQGCQHIFL
jgi:hypothetical protein